jgi:AbiV family abortive infection protein
MIIAGGRARQNSVFFSTLLEECAKIQTIGAWAVKVLAGLPVDEKKGSASLRRHGNKNRTNAYMMEGSGAERDARKRGDWKTALAEFSKYQTEFHATSNVAKNAPLYVDFEGGTFVAPVDRISPEMVADIADRNEGFLGLTFPYLRMLLQWERSPDDAQEAAVAFVGLAEKMNAATAENASAAFDNLIGEFLEAELKKRAAKRAIGMANC